MKKRRKKKKKSHFLFVISNSSSLEHWEENTYQLPILGYNFKENLWFECQTLNAGEKGMAGGMGEKREGKEVGGMDWHLVVVTAPTITERKNTC